MNWINLNNINQLDVIAQESKENPVLIYKHSSRCNVSQASLDRQNRNAKPEELTCIKTYYLDLISYRNISNAVAQKFGIEHESPQAILVRDGREVWNASHSAITVSSLQRAVGSIR